MAGSNASKDGRGRPSDGKVVVFSRVEPGLPPLFDEVCDMLLKTTSPQGEHRPPERKGRSGKVEFALREVVRFAAAEYPREFTQALSDTPWEDPEAVRAELAAEGLGDFASAVWDGTKKDQCMKCGLLGHDPADCPFED